MIEVLKNKIYLMIGRAILKAATNTTKTATIQVTGLKGETISGIEYFSPYGFEGMPSAGQAAIVFINGNRDQGIALALHDRETRPKTLEPDETELWSKFNNYVKCNKSGEVEINGKTDYAVAYTDLKAAFDKLVSDFNALVTAYNSHTHPTAAPGAPSVGSAPGTSSAADMSGAKVEKVRLP